ncbi:hypothetical protein EYC84_008246 [Monilinia fructicola]|uniref:Septin-type G domain-containing protein n=1 Tax=Monilinia fructicola TaxID=38448 RepID=A0A5M9JHG3_MONFR|nr:hypothetical protein EYC84_008246 [Monilinia fructicola]
MCEVLERSLAILRDSTTIFLAEESRIKRNPRFRDNRVHALLYFITPTGHGLRELDIELMKRLSPRVNVIPVIGKADSLTPAELAESKKLVMEDIEHYRIPVYNFPYDIEEDDEDTVEENAELRGLMPFAIVGSEEVVEIGGRQVRARQYPWGVVEVDNPRHSDFLAIRSALLHSHLADLKEITHDFLYENYRTEKLSKSVEGGSGGDASMNPEDLASQSVRLKEEQLRREEEKLREIEIKVQREIEAKRQELLAREMLISKQPMEHIRSLKLNGDDVQGKCVYAWKHGWMTCGDGDANRLLHMLSFGFLKLGIFFLQVVDGAAFILALQKANNVVSYCLLMCS